MKAAYYDINGGPDVLDYGDLPDPTATDGHVLVRVQAISLEGGDVLGRRNNPPRHPPHVGGYAAAGVIESVGSGVTNLAVGQRVACFNWQGSHAELFAVPVPFVFPVPDALDIKVAAVGLIAFGTAHDALFEFGRLEPGETVLVQGAAGGVGLAAVQLANRAGATVIATASSAQRIGRLQSFGATHGIDYRQENIGVRTRELTDGVGVDLVVDLAGGNALRSLLQALRYRGRLIAVGGASGEGGGTFEFSDIAPESLAVFGMLFGKELHTARVHEMIAGIFDDMATGRISMPVDRTFPLAEAAAAHRHAEEGHPFGRILLVP
ncbi:quinone oxidoreductase family protein [Salinicola peritrichatus]|uniref:quinone oxidoreductase family protein n=1 Tax=Salinicola peritrichatus TaxID=1267424 RepID=UPI000DA15DC9|nr:zinc-binding alcohol dehydrogenase family protein [Salinicola peritrichatus]